MLLGIVILAIIFGVQIGHYLTIKQIREEFRREFLQEKEKK